MQAGRLSTRCVIQRRTGGTNDWGEPLPEGWETHATVWANVRRVALLSRLVFSASPFHERQPLATEMQ